MLITSDLTFTMPSQAKLNGLESITQNLYMNTFSAQLVLEAKSNLLISPVKLIHF